MSAKEEAEDILENIQPPLTLEEIDEKAEKLAELTRSLTRNRVGFYVLGLGVGAITGYFIAKHRLETKYSKIADEEIAEMREHYREKATALEASAAKKPVDEIVKERGYSSSKPENVEPPMAIQPPTPSRVIEAEDEAAGEPPDDEESDDQEVHNIFEEVPPVDHEWDYQVELKKRSPDIPYVIHTDERFEMEGYEEVTLTYYTLDDVLCTLQDEVIDPDYERDKLIGEGNLDRFGHGSGDPSIVYIRNDKLELIYEVVKSPNSYAEVVHGFTHYSNSYRNLERMRAREHDNEQED
jgi:hypothetical protein